MSSAVVARSCPVVSCRVGRGRRTVMDMTSQLVTTISQKPPLFTVASALSPAECAALIRLAEEAGFGEAPVTVGPNRFAMMPDLRNNTRVILDDERMARGLWERLRTLLPARLAGMEAVGLNERFRFYRYTAGQQFDWHRDGAFHRSSDEHSLLTLIFYLNEGCRGGETEFMFVEEDVIQVSPRQGHALVFSHPLYHRGAPVIEGTKYVLRTDVMYRRAG